MDMLLTVVVSALAHTGDKNERGWFVFAISGLPRCDPLVIRALRPQVPRPGLLAKRLPRPSGAPQWRHQIANAVKWAREKQEVPVVKAQICQVVLD